MLQGFVEKNFSFSSGLYQKLNSFDVNEGSKIVVVNESSQNFLSPSGYFFSAISFLIIWIVGTIGNFLVLVLFYKNKPLRTPINMLLLNLAVFDFMMSAFGSPFPFIAAILRKWPFGKLMCTFYGFIMAYGGIGSITTLMVLSFERYLMISRPFDCRGIDKSKVAGIIVSIWFYTALVTVPPLLGWASYDFEGPKLSCSIGWEAGDKVTNAYIIFLFVLGLVVPVLVIVFSSCQIIHTVRMASGQQSRSASRAEVNVVRMLFVMITAFIFAWTPYAIVSILITLGVAVSPPLALIPALIAKSSACYNPIIYVGLNTQFRIAWRKLFGYQETENNLETSVTATAGTAAGNFHLNSPTTTQFHQDSPIPPKNTQVSP